MKQYECLVPGCSWQAHGEDEADIVRRASEHLRAAHNETTIRPNMIEQIKSRVTEAEKTSN
jgi:predicted small metal-binding protein